MVNNIVWKERERGRERAALTFVFVSCAPQQLELEKSRSKLTKVTEEAETERKEEVGRKEAEIQQLKQKLETQTEEVNKQQVQTQAHKEYLDKITLELEAMKVRTASLSVRLYKYFTNICWCFIVPCGKFQLPYQGNSSCLTREIPVAIPGKFQLPYQGNSSCLSGAPQLQEQCYPFLSACVQYFHVSK